MRDFVRLRKEVALQTRWRSRAEEVDAGHRRWGGHRPHELVARGNAGGTEALGDLLAAPALGNRGHETALDLASGEHLNDVVGRHRAAELVVARGQRASDAGLLGGDPKDEPGADEATLLQIGPDVAG